MASLLVVVLAAGGAYAGHRTVCAANNQNFEITVDAFETNVADRIGALRMISAAILVVMSPDGGGVTLDDIESLTTGESLSTLGLIAPLIIAFPWDGLSAVAFATRESDGTVTPAMLPNGGGLTGDTVSWPPILEAVNRALDSGELATSDPFRAHDYYPGPLLVQVTPMSDRSVVVSFVNATSLVEDAIRGSGAATLHAVVRDLKSDTILADTGRSDHPDMVRAFDARLSDRPWELTVTPGPDFPWQSSTGSWISILALGFLLAGIVFMAGLRVRRTSLEQEERLRVAQQIDEDKDRFIAAVSHELRTPLTALVGFSDTMAAAANRLRADEINEFGRIMAQQSKEMAMLIEDLLVAARSKEGRLKAVPTVVELHTEVEAIVGGLGEGRDRITVAGGQAAAWADPLRVRQVIRNLLTNAIRHGGPAVTVGVGVQSGCAITEVSDNGPGISDTARARMFEPYYHAAASDARAPSVGLGLSVARQLADLMGGTIDYRYEAGLSIFRLSLPLPVPPAPAADRAPVLAGRPT